MTRVHKIDGVTIWTCWTWTGRREGLDKVEKTLVAVGASRGRGTTCRVIPKILGSAREVHSLTVEVGQNGGTSLCHQTCSVSHWIGGEVGEAFPIVVIYGARVCCERPVGAHPYVAVRVGYPV